MARKPPGSIKRVASIVRAKSVPACHLERRNDPASSRHSARSRQAQSQNPLFPASTKLRARACDLRAPMLRRRAWPEFPHALQLAMR